MLLPALLVVALIIGFVIMFVVVPHGEDKDRCAKEAAEIAKIFGDREITLFKFPNYDVKYGKGQNYAILPFDSRRDDDEEIFNVPFYYDLTFWHEDSAATKKSADQKLRMVKYILPYEMPERTTDVDWLTFRRTNDAKREAKSLGKTFNEFYKDNLVSCYSVTEGNGSTPDDLIFIVFGEGEPFKKGTNFQIIWSERYNEENHRNAIKQANLILEYSSIKDKTIHETGLTYAEAFAHYND